MNKKELLNRRAAQMADVNHEDMDFPGNLANHDLKQANNKAKMLNTYNEKLDHWLLYRHNFEKALQKRRKLIKKEYGTETYMMDDLNYNWDILLIRLDEKIEQLEKRAIVERFEEGQTEIKRSTFNNETTAKMKQAAADAAPMKVEIYEQALDVIGSQHLAHFLTESGDASADLYAPIIMRTNYTKAQVRYHLNTAINGGLDPELPGIKKKFAGGMLWDLLLDTGFAKKDVSS